MACANGSVVNTEQFVKKRRRRGHIAGAGAAEPAHSDRFATSETVASSSPQLTEGPAASGRNRRASSSSCDSANSQHLQRSRRGRKRSGRKHSGTAASQSTSNPPPVTAAAAAAVTEEGVSDTCDDTLGDGPAENRCSQCEAELPDNTVTLCDPCWTLPFPLSFLKLRHLPIWMHEPEDVMVPPPEKKVIGENGIKEVHSPADSLFSTSSGFTNYRGLLNLALILLLLSSARLMIENLMKYGVLIEPIGTFSIAFQNFNTFPNLKIMCYQPVHSIIVFVLEKYFLAKDRIPDLLAVVIYAFSGLIQLSFPAYIALSDHPSPVLSALTLAVVTIHFLKLVSYAHVNYWCRLHRRQPPSTKGHRRRPSTGEKFGGIRPNGYLDPDNTAPIVEYPDNLNIPDLLYFLVAPTLCYELNFPRSQRIRKRFLIKRIIEMFFLVLVIIGLVQQWIVPTINNAIKPLSEMDAVKIVERLLKLSIPNHLIWLMFFYVFFHSMLNVLAELLMFGDRVFYQDWWNAVSVSQFWKLWNIPVHRWAIRHVYIPLRRRGAGGIGGSIVVFAISAFFHEYLVSVPLRMFKTWAFFGMLMQIPLACLSEKYLDPKWGNIVVWLSLILGQPIAILAYVHDYYVINLLNPFNATATMPAGPTTSHMEL